MSDDSSSSGLILYGYTFNCASFIVTGLNDGRIEFKIFEEGRVASRARLAPGDAVKVVNAIDKFAHEQALPSPSQNGGTNK